MSLTLLFLISLLTLGIAALQLATNRWRWGGVIWILTIGLLTLAMGDTAMEQGRISIQAFLADHNVLSAVMGIVLLEIMVFVPIAAAKCASADTSKRSSRREWIWQFVGLSPFMGAFAVLVLALNYIPGNFDLDLMTKLVAFELVGGMGCLWVAGAKIRRKTSLILELTIVLRLLCALVIVALLSLTQSKVPQNIFVVDTQALLIAMMSVMAGACIGFLWYRRKPSSRVVLRD